MSNNDVRNKVDGGILRSNLQMKGWTDRDIDFLIMRFEEGELLAKCKNSLKSKNEKLQRTIKELVG